jgi:hypothetical protein
MKKIQQPRRKDVTGENEAEHKAEGTRRYLEAVTLANQRRKLVLQELLSKPGAEILPLVVQEFFELCIEESDDVFRPAFVDELGTFSEYGLLRLRRAWEIQQSSEGLTTQHNTRILPLLK